MVQAEIFSKVIMLVMGSGTIGSGSNWTVHRGADLSK